MLCSYVHMGCLFPLKLLPLSPLLFFPATAQAVHAYLPAPGEFPAQESLKRFPDFLFTDLKPLLVKPVLDNRYGLFVLLYNKHRSVAFISAQVEAFPGMHLCEPFAYGVYDICLINHPGSKNRLFAGQLQYLQVLSSP